LQGRARAAADVWRAERAKVQPVLASAERARRVAAAAAAALEQAQLAETAPAAEADRVEFADVPVKP
jgi:hypothetical protein